MARDSDPVTNYLFREPYAAPRDAGVPPPEYRRSVEAGMIVERNVAVRLRDGVEIFADVFRPPDERPAPPIIAWTPYGKHQNGARIFEAYPDCEVRRGQVSPYATFEGPDPAYWVPRGYVIINADIRGLFHSGGDATFISPEEARDFNDLIEWAGTQAWSNGRVGASGVSYLAVSQWRVAALRPPHLAAINPWEGWTDTYREVAFHGGIPDTSFWLERLPRSWGTGLHRIEDLVLETRAHPLFDAFWETKCAPLSQVTVPAFVVACWADQGLHLRGTLEGFKQISSPQKYLDVHGRKKWAYYYDPECVERLRQFFDHYLKGERTGVDGWPRVRLEVREKYFAGEVVREHEWPIARTRYTRLYLDAASGAMTRAGQRAEASISYSALGSGPGASRAAFDVTFREPTRLIGHMKLRLHVSAVGADDLDVFVGTYKLDARGEPVPFAYYSFFNDGPVSLGWLRASHRELDPARSTEFQPVHTHRRVQKPAPGEIVALDIELWPSATSFAPGESLRLIVQGTDLQKYAKGANPIYFRHEDTVNAGRHVIHTGGRFDSHLLVPVVPMA